MADADSTTYPLSYDPLPSVQPLDRQNAPGLEHDELHTRANAILNALQQLIGLVDEETPPATLLERLALLEDSGGGGGGPAPTTERAYTTTSHVLTEDDLFCMVCMNNAAANQVVVPLDSVLPVPPGTRIDVSQDGAGQTSIVGATGAVQIRTPRTAKIGHRYGKATLIRRVGTDLWDLEGNLEAAP